MKTEINQVIMQYVHKPNPIENLDTIITHITSMESVTKTAISNFQEHFQLPLD